MAQKLFEDKINDISVQSVTSVLLEGENKITVGGQQYSIDNQILNTGTIGLNGLDTGSLAALTMYNVFAVASGSAAGLVASTSGAPVGFTAYSKIGEFYTNSVPSIVAAYSLNGKKPVVVQSNGTNFGPNASYASDSYMPINCSVVLGVGLWSIDGLMQTGNSGGSGEQLFLQCLFADADAPSPNGGAAPAQTNTSSYYVGGNIAPTIGQFAPSASGADFNSRGFRGTMILNITTPHTLYFTARVQANNPQFVTASGQMFATRLGSSI